MNIAIISPNSGAYGGVEAYVFFLARHFSQRGFRVRIVFKRIRHFQLEEHFGRLVAASPVSTEFVGRASPALFRAIRWADVVHLQNASPDVVALASLARRPVVMTVHYNGLMPRSLRLLGWRLAMRVAARRVFISRFVEESWEGGRRRPGSAMVHSVCDLPGRESSRAGRRGFAFVARWVPNKGLRVLIEAYAGLQVDRDRWPMRLMGTGPLQNEVMRRLDANDAHGIETLGFVTAEQKHAVLGSARWVVVPAHTNEDLGLVPFEARSLGVPCIVTRDGGLPESGGRHALVCERNSVTSLRAALQRAIDMSDAEYEARALATRAELGPQIAGHAYYESAYRELAPAEKAI